MTWRPLSKRSDEVLAAEYDALHEGVPQWLIAPVSRWIGDYFENLSKGAGGGADVMTAIEYVAQMLRLPLPHHPKYPNMFQTPLGALQAALTGAQTLDIIDAVLWLTGSVPTPYAERDDFPRRLEGLLSMGGSAWKVGHAPDGGLRLVRRVDETVEAAARSQIERGGSAGRHLHRAWHGVFGRQPNPSHAYREAVRAVEAAAKPVIVPTDQMATLGKMIDALRDTPSKWTVDVGSIDTVRHMMESIWKSQLDRHGTDDETAPLHVSREEAVAAVYLAVTLVSWFRDGVVATKSG